MQIATQKERCAGCTACASVCPVGAIQMQPDAQGFSYPHIDADKCITCHRCEKACYYVSGLPASTHSHVQECYAAWRAQYAARRVSQSGGIGAALAEHILARGGIVYGAAFDEQFVVRHQRYTDIETAAALRGAKYVQSDLEGIFQQVKTDIRGGGDILFFGTPCQIAGLKKFLAKEYENLWLVDLICHGVPSPRIWQEYLTWLTQQHRGETLEVVRIRDPQFGWHSNQANFCFRGKWFASNDYNNLYGCGIMLRSTCYACPFTNLTRMGDLTIGDCWGIEQVDPALDQAAGVSIVLANSTRGKALFDALPDIVRHAIPIEKVRQPQLRYPTPRHPRSKEFWQDAAVLSMDKLLFRYVRGGYLGSLKRLLRPILGPVKRCLLRVWKHPYA